MLEFNGNAIYLSKGDTGSLALTITDEEQQTYDYSGDTVVFSLKRFVTDANPILQKTFTDGKITFESADTANLQAGEYLYDIVLTHETEDATQVCTVIKPTTFTIGPVVH